MLGDTKLLIYSKNPVIHFASLDLKMLFNVVDSLGSKIKHLQRMMRNREFVWKEQDCSSAEPENSVTGIPISTIQI